MQWACSHVLDCVCSLWPSANSVILSSGFTFGGLLWPHGDSLYKILPVQSQKLWKQGLKAMWHGKRRHLRGHSSSGRGLEMEVSVTP